MSKTSGLQNIFRILLGVMMILPGIGHLTFQRTEFLAQVPSWLPDNPALLDFIVVASGIVEILLGLALIFVTKHKAKVGIALAIFYVLVFPGNLSQYTNGIDAFGLDTDLKRLIRLFFQPILILWALWSTGAITYLKHRRKEKREAKSISFYEFEALDISGKPVQMESFRGKLVVVVNTASTVEPSPGEDHRIPWDVACPGRGLLAEASGSRQSLRQDCCESASSLAVTEADCLQIRQAHLA